MNALSPRQLEVLKATARGLTIEQTAAELGTRPSTVRTQGQSILRKLRAHSRAHAVAIAFDRGILAHREGAP